MRHRLLALLLLATTVLAVGLAAPLAATEPAYLHNVGPTFSTWPIWIGAKPASTSVDSLLYLSGSPTGVEYGFYSASALPSYFAGNFAAKVVQPSLLAVAALPTCNAALSGAYASVTDGNGAADCTVGGSTTDVACYCNGSAWTAVGASVDVSGYVLITAAAQQSITASGAGNDVTLVAADDVILNPTDALTGTVGGAVAITTTAGAIGLTAGGTTQDITLTAVDDVILAPTGDLTGTIGAAVAITTTAGAIGLTAGGTTQDITLTSVDDVILAATDDTTVAGDQFAVNTTTAVIDAGGNADEITVAAGSTTLTGSLILPIASAPPAACAAGTKGTIYYDSDINKLCICNATAYVLVDDATTTTGCS